jgi:hypothetical protein
VQALGPDQVFGSSALLENQVTLFQVRARERTSAMRIESAALQATCKSDAAGVTKTKPSEAAICAVHFCTTSCS